MLAVKRSPLFRIALLSFAVLFAHTGRATNVDHILPVKPPCAGKVAAAQPDSDKKLAPAIRRFVRPDGRAHFHTTAAHPLVNSAAAFRAAQASTRTALARQLVYIPSQRLPFDLRI